MWGADAIAKHALLCGVEFMASCGENDIASVSDESGIKGAEGFAKGGPDDVEIRNIAEQCTTPQLQRLLSLCIPTWLQFGHRVR